MLDAASISTVLDVYRPERDALIALLARLSDDDWAAPTECPAYSVKGIACHILGDDLSLLSRQRDGAQNGLLQVAVDNPGADFRGLLDTFNDRWVLATQFLSTDLLLELLRLTGEWTATYYENVDPASDGEPVGFFGHHGPSSPMWHAIAREYIERWVHHSQIRRALDLGPLSDSPFLDVGVAVVAVAARAAAATPEKATDQWTLGPLILGDRVQSANILTRGLTATELQAVVTGPPGEVDRLASFAGRP